MSASLDSEKFKTSPVELHPMLAFGWRSCGAVGGTDGGPVTFHEGHPLVLLFSKLLSVVFIPIVTMFLFL